MSTADERWSHREACAQIIERDFPEQAQRLRAGEYLSPHGVPGDREAFKMCNDAPMVPHG